MPDEVAPRKPRRWPGRAIAILVLLMLVGHISNAVGLKKCERDLLRRFTGEIESIFDTTGGREIHLRSDVDYGIMATRLEQINAPHRYLSPEEIRKAPYPTCQMSAAVPVCPFVVAIDFCEMTGSLGGTAGRVYMFNFFGLNLIICYAGDWVS